MARAIFDSITKQDTAVRQSRDQRAAEARDSSIKSYRVKSARESLCEVSGRTTERICERNACRRGGYEKDAGGKEKEQAMAIADINSDSARRQATGRKLKLTKKHATPTKYCGELRSFVRRGRGSKGVRGS